MIFKDSPKTLVVPPHLWSRIQRANFNFSELKRDNSSLHSPMCVVEPQNGFLELVEGVNVARCLDSFMLEQLHHHQQQQQLHQHLHSRNCTKVSNCQSSTTSPETTNKCSILLQKCLERRKQRLVGKGHKNQMVR
mmetsp:Transcript_3204/g.12244  ORF Transcript_3204/g.12244 Transcript_3204/m.12244 type:complete len:135 (-) Transcript_3204:292-696(-)